MNKLEINGVFKKKRKGWPIFFMLLAIAFPVLNYLHFHWLNSILAVAIGVVVFIFCIARINRIKKLNKMKLSCCESDLYASDGKHFYRIPYDKIKRVKKICKKGIKVKAIKLTLRLRRLKNRKEILNLIKQKMELAKQPAPIQVDPPVIEDTIIETVNDVPALEQLLTANKTPVVLALVMNAPANGIPAMGTPMVQASAPVQAEPKIVLPELPTETPVTVDQKLNYIKILWLRGDISEEEKNLQCEIIYREEFPELYGGKAKKVN